MEHDGPNWQQFLTVVGLLVAAAGAVIRLAVGMSKGGTPT